MEFQILCKGTYLFASRYPSTKDSHALIEGEEIFIGAVDKPQLITPITDMGIVGHANTWAYTCGRRHSLQLGGLRMMEDRIEKFGVPDKVGVALNMND